MRTLFTLQNKNKSTLESHKEVLGEASVPVDVESSKSLILSWAKKLEKLNMSRGVTKKACMEAEVTTMKNKDVCDISKDERIMMWAHELQTVTEVRNKTLTGKKYLNVNKNK